MAETVIWSQESLDDIDAIAEYISRDSPYHAQRVVEAILAIAQLLATQPKLGRIVPELGREHIREHFLYSYRIIYEIQAPVLQILAVIHGKRLLESVNERFSDKG